MKRLFFHFALLFVSFSCICGMCSKSNTGDTDPYPGNMHTKGFLVTIGVTSSGATDSVCLRYGPAFPVRDYSTELRANGFVDESKHTWEIVNSGANTWFFKYKDGRYLGISYNDRETGDARFLCVQDNSPGERNMFVINKTDGKFLIQPVSHPQVYLNTHAIGGQPPVLRHGFVNFMEGKKQYWFLVP